MIINCLLYYYLSQDYIMNLAVQSRDIHRHFNADINRLAVLPSNSYNIQNTDGTNSMMSDKK